MKGRSKLERYGLAMICCGVALAVAWPIDAPSSCFLLAVTVSGLFGGLGPGLLSVAFSSIAFEYFFLRRTFSIATEPATYLRFAVFLAAALLITGLMETKRRVEESRSRTEEALRQSQADLERISRLTTMGELTASLAHEVNQPIAAAVTDGNTCLRWLARDQPNVEEARLAASRVVQDATRASAIVNRIRSLFQKGAPQRELVDVNEVIREMVVLLRSEATRHSMSLRTQLEVDIPRVMGDRVQLQQVLMNLMMNSIDAMKDVDGTRELDVKSRRGENEELVVSVSDTGPGLPAQQADQIFNAFFTTKPHGTGMGLRISRPSWNRMAAACGLPIILHAAQAFTSPCPPKLRFTTDTHSRSHPIQAGIISLIPRHNCAVVGGRIGYNYGYSGGGEIGCDC
jgi:signal transduction histidine kinase